MKGVSPFVRKLHEFSRSSCSHLLVCSVSKDGQCSLRNSRIKCNSLATQSNFLFYLLSNTEFCWQVFTYSLFTEVGGLNTILLNWSYLETCCDGLLQGIQKSWLNLNYNCITSVNTVLSDLNVSDMNHDYKFRLRLAVVKVIPDICNSLYKEYNAF
jgi:hypothetical protein